MAKKKKRTRFKWLLKRHFCAGAGLWMNVNGKSWNNSGKRMSPTHRGRRETEKKTEKEVKRRRRFQKKKKKWRRKKTFRLAITSLSPSFFFSTQHWLGQSCCGAQGKCPQSDIFLWKDVWRVLSKIFWYQVQAEENFCFSSKKRVLIFGLRHFYFFNRITFWHHHVDLNAPVKRESSGDSGNIKKIWIGVYFRPLRGWYGNRKSLFWYGFQLVIRSYLWYEKDPFFPVYINSLWTRPLLSSCRSLRGVPFSKKVDMDIFFN